MNDSVEAPESAVAAADAQCAGADCSEREDAVALDEAARRETSAPYHAAKRRAASRKNAAKAFVHDKTPDKLKNPTDIQVRFRTGFVYVSISLVCALACEFTTVLLLCVLAGISAGELFYMFRSDAKLPNELLGIMAAIAYPISIWLFGLDGALLVTGALLLALLVWYVFWSRARIGDVGVSFFGAAYTGLLLSGLIVVRMSIEGFWGGVLVCAVFCSVWANDSFAYLVGSKLGKHKMAPRISPKKSWEGFVGGMLGSVAVWLCISCIPGVDMSILQSVVFGVVVGLFGVLGDLAESRIKRNSGVKDSGTIMPGHGGLLDRCDSLFLASVTSAVLLVGGGCVPFVL